MKIELKLNNTDADIFEIKELIAEKNIKGVQLKIQEKTPEPGSLSGADYLPIIQMVLGSTVVAGGVKGIFDILKTYFDLKKRKVDLDQTKIDAQKIEFTFEDKSGKKGSVKFNSFDEKERKKFFETVDSVLAK